MLVSQGLGNPCKFKHKHVMWEKTKIEIRVASCLWGLRERERISLVREARIGLGAGLGVRKL